MADVIMKLQPEIAYVDSSDVLPDRFGQDISSMLPAGIKVVSEHHADSRYPVVGAASILGKVRRDAIIQELAQRYGDLGSGYPSDPKTIRFLEDWYDRHGSFPDFARKSWKTLERITERRQRKL
jgi:ribonuclease HII